MWGSSNADVAEGTKIGKWSFGSDPNFCHIKHITERINSDTIGVSRKI